MQLALYAVCLVIDRGDNMSDYYNKKKKNSKTTKSHSALKNAFLILLYNRNFSKISVNDLCIEAKVSRSTFYVYFDDKYDLLEYCMNDLKIIFDTFAKEHNEEQIIVEINDYVFNNARLLKNLLADNNNEVMILLLHFFTPNLSRFLSNHEKCSGEISLPHLVLANFCAGGIANLLLWQVKNNFPINRKMMSSYLYKMQKGIETLDLE